MSLYKGYFNYTEKLPGEPRLRTVIVDAKDQAEATAKVRQYLLENFKEAFTQVTKVTPA